MNIKAWERDYFCSEIEDLKGFGRKRSSYGRWQSMIFYKEKRESSIRFRDNPEMKLKSFLIFPDDLFKIVWDLFIFLILVYSVVVTPYRLSFIDDHESVWIVIDYLIDFCFFLDFIITCFTVCVEGDEVIIEFKKIISCYVKTWMVVDVISGVPFVVIGVSYQWINLIKLLKISKIKSQLKIVNFRKSSKTVKKILSSDFVQYMVHLPLRLKIFIYFFIFFCMVCHILACVWYSLSKYNAQRNWIIKYGCEDISRFDMYVISLYWVMTTLSTVGYGDITPDNNIERGFCIIVMLLGVFFYSYSVGIITNIMIGSDKLRLSVDNKKFILQEIKKKYSISNSLEKQILQHIKLNDANISKQTNQILKSLPRRLSLQLSYYINKSIGEKRNKFFKEKPIFFISQILECLKSVKLPQKEIIFLQGFLSNEMYFITKGQVAIYSKEFSAEITIEVLVHGDYFGDIEILLEEDRLFSSKTIGFCDLLILSKESLFNILSPFDDLKKDLENEAKERRKNLFFKFEKHSAEFNINRELIFSLDEKKRKQTSFDLEGKIKRDRVKLDRIKSSLCNKTLKMISNKNDNPKSLRVKVDNLENDLLGLINKYNLDLL